MTGLSFNTKYLTARKSLFFMAGGLIVFVLYLYFFVGFDRLFLVVSSVNPSNYLTFYILALVAMLLVMFFWVYSWRWLLKALGVRISLRNAYLYYWAGYFVDLIVPCQQVCGEITRLYLVQKETRENYGLVGAAGVTNRLIGYTIVTTGLTAGVIYLLIRNKIPTFATYLLILSWLGAVIYLSVLLTLALTANGADRLASLTLWILKKLRIKRYRSQTNMSVGLVESLKKFHEGFDLFRNRRRQLIIPFVSQSIAYSITLLAYVFVFYSLGFKGLLFDFFLLVYFLAGAIQDATSAFSVGGLEIILTNLFAFFGISLATSGVAAAVLRSVTFWFPLLVGYFIVQVLGARSILNPNVRKRLESEQEKGQDLPTSDPSSKLGEIDGLYLWNG